MTEARLNISPFLSFKISRLANIVKVRNVDLKKWTFNREMMITKTNQWFTSYIYRIISFESFRNCLCLMSFFSLEHAMPRFFISINALVRMYVICLHLLS